MDYIKQADYVRSNTVFVERIRQALVSLSVDISAEASSGKYEIDQGRSQYAYSVLADPQRYANVWRYAIVTNVNCGQGGKNDPLEDDGALKFVVSSMFNGFAGVMPNKAAYDAGAASIAGEIIPPTMATLSAAEGDPTTESDPTSSEKNWFQKLIRKN